MKNHTRDKDLNQQYPHSQFSPYTIKETCTTETPSSCNSGEGYQKWTWKVINGKSVEAGGCYQQKGRSTWRIWFPWKGKKLFINRYLDGTPLYIEKQARFVLEKIRGEVAAGTFDPSSWGKDRTIDFQRAWNIYMEQCPCGKRRMEARERIFKDFLLPYFKGSSLKEIEEHHIMEWWTTISKTYAPSYLGVIKATLKAFLNFHRVTRVKMIRFPIVKIPKKTPSWLSKDEQERILGFIPSHHQAIFRFLMLYGCRVDEACSLKKTDIDWVKDEITFRERKNDKDNTIKIFDEVRSYLRGGGKITHLEFVFCTVNGAKYTQQNLHKLWTKACKKANIKVIPLKNGTRHSLACQLLEQNTSAAMVARILGNTPTMIERAYGSITALAASEALRKISKGNV